MTTSQAQLVPGPNSRLAVPTVPGRRLRVAHSEDPSAEHRADTSRRAADTYTEVLTPREFDFPHDKGHDELVSVRRIPVQSRRRAGLSPLFGLAAVLARPVAVVVHTSAALMALPGRVIGLVTSAEQALAAMHAAVARTNALLDRVNGVTDRAEGVAQAASRAATAAAAAVEQASMLIASAAPLLESYSEPLRRLEPTVRRIADTTDPHEVDALVTLMDRLPQLVDAMNNDVIPLLGHLDQIGHDLNQLLDTVSNLNHIVSRLPKVRWRHRDGTAVG